MYPQLKLTASIRAFKGFFLAHRNVLINIFLFILVTFILHKLWWMWLWPSLSFLHEWASTLANWVFLSSSWLLDKVFLVEHQTTDNTLLFSNGYIAVWNSCSGLKQFYQLFFLLLFFPGPFKHKLWYIPAGMVLIFIMNIFRILALTFVLLYFPAYWDFAHLWILRPFYYVIIFVVWMIWVEKFMS